MDEKTVIALSRELNEPKWLLEERVKAFKIWSLLAKGKNESYTSELDVVAECKGMRQDPLHLFLEDKNRKDIAKNIFLHRFFKPANSLEAAFVNAFFTEVNFFGQSGKETKGKIKLSTNSVSINFFILPDNFSLELEVLGSTTKSASICEYYVPENSSVSGKSVYASNSIYLNATMLNKNARCTNEVKINSGAVVDNRTLFFETGGSCSEKTVFCLGGEEQLDFNSVAIHNAGGTSSDISVRGVVRNNSFAKLAGLAKISKNAFKVNSQISEHVLILDEGARATANPNLEILNNDVVASHSASVGEIDPDQVFYLMSRGLSEADAKNLIVEGFLG